MPSSQNILVSLSFLKDVFHGHKVRFSWAYDISFLSALDKYHFFLASMFATVSNCLCYRKGFVFLFLFQNVLSLIFKSIMIICLDMEFFEFTPFVVYQFLEFVHLSLAKFKMFSAIISLYTFLSPPPFSFSSWDSDHMKVRSFVLISQVPDNLFIFAVNFLPVVQIDCFLLFCLQVH